MKPWVWNVHVASTRASAGPPDLSYRLHDRDILVTACGRIRMHRKTVLAGQTLGIKMRNAGMAISRSRYRNHAFQVMVITGSRDRDHREGATRLT
jgi:hypothetical protein